MATQNTIFDIQNQLQDARTAAVTAVDCIDVECNLSVTPDSLGTIYPENHEVWQQVYHSAVLLQVVLNELVEKLSNELG